MATVSPRTLSEYIARLSRLQIGQVFASKPRSRALYEHYQGEVYLEALVAIRLMGLALWVVLKRGVARGNVGATDIFPRLQWRVFEALARQEGLEVSFERFYSVRDLALSLFVAWSPVMLAADENVCAAA